MDKTMGLTLLLGVLLLHVGVHGKAVIPIQNTETGTEHAEEISIEEIGDKIFDTHDAHVHDVQNGDYIMDNEDTRDIMEEYTEDLLEGPDEDMEDVDKIIEEDRLHSMEDKDDNDESTSSSDEDSSESSDESEINPDNIDDELIIDVLDEVKDIDDQFENGDDDDDDESKDDEEYGTKIGYHDDEDDFEDDNHDGDGDDYHELGDNFDDKEDDYHDDQEDYHEYERENNPNNDDDDDHDDEIKIDNETYENEDDDKNDDDLDDIDDDGPVKVEFRPVPVPTNFDDYDVLEKDGVITLEELINVTGAHEHVMDAFHDTDTNDDGLVSREEFQKAPWVLAGIPDENAAPAELIHDMEEDIEQMTEAKHDLGKKSKKADKVLDTLIIKEEHEENEVIKTASDKDLEQIHIKRRKSHWNALG